MNKKWYKRWWGVLLILIFPIILLPIVIYQSNFNKLQKLILSILYSIFLFLPFVVIPIVTIITNKPINEIKEEQTQIVKQEIEKNIEIETEKGKVKIPKNIRKIVVMDEEGVIFGSLTKDWNVNSEIIRFKENNIYLDPDEKENEILQDLNKMEPELEVKKNSLDLNEVIELKPDLIIIDENYEEYYKNLKNIDPTIYLNFKNPNPRKDKMVINPNLIKSMKILAKIFNQEKRVDESIKELQKKIDEMNKINEEYKNRYR
nr:ABC transporter substrate-binding protein [uncultured Leptotrichia sp.]